MIQESFAIKGRIHAELRGADGQLKQVLDKDNLIVQVGKNAVATLVATAAGVAAFTYMAVGTSNTAPAIGDTILGAESARVANTSTTAANNVVTFVASFGPGVGTGTLQEAGIFNASGANAGTMLSHVLLGTFTKNSGDTLTITWTVTFG